LNTWRNRINPFRHGRVRKKIKSHAWGQAKRRNGKSRSFTRHASVEERSQHSFNGEKDKKTINRTTRPTRRKLEPLEKKNKKKARRAKSSVLTAHPRPAPALTQVTPGCWLMPDPKQTRRYLATTQVEEKDQEWRSFFLLSSSHTHWSTEKQPKICFLTSLRAGWTHKGGGG